MSLKEPYFLRKPSAKLVGKDRAAAVARVLAEFLSQYTRYSTLHHSIHSIQYSTHSTQYTTPGRPSATSRPRRTPRRGCRPRSSRASSSTPRKQVRPVTVKMEVLTPAPAPDLEGVLTFQTKLQGCTHIFIGKCVSPPSR